VIPAQHFISSNIELQDTKGLYLTYLEKNQMRTIGTFLGIVLLAALVLTIGSGLLVLMAYGLGWVINHVVDLNIFQATMLSLAGIFIFIILADRVIHAFTSLAPVDIEDDNGFDDEDESDELDEFEIVEDEEVLDKLYTGIPRWRRPNKSLDFSNTKPDSRCPCGSGRKYKNCHGSKHQTL